MCNNPLDIKTLMKQMDACGLDYYDYYASHVVTVDLDCVRSLSIGYNPETFKVTGLEFELSY